MERFIKAKILLMNVVILGVVLAFAGRSYGDCYQWSVGSAPSGGSISHPNGTEHFHTDENQTLTCSRASDSDNWYHSHDCSSGSSGDSMSSSHPRWTVSAGTLVTNYSTSVTYHTPSTKTLGVSVKIYDDDLPNSISGCDSGSRNDSETLQDTKTVDVFCPHPTNFRQTDWNDLGDGRLWFKYEWDSDCGVVAHLTNCWVREYVLYPQPADPYYWPDPPWNWSTPNPTTPGVAGTAGTGQDTHSTGTFATPYGSASFSANQNYEYNCSKCMASGWYVNLLTIGSIDREVFLDSIFPIIYRYKIQKSGKEAQVNLP